MHKARVSTHPPDSKSLLLNICESTKHTQLEMLQFAAKKTHKKQKTETPGIQSPQQNNNLGNMMGEDVN